MNGIFGRFGGVLAVLGVVLVILGSGYQLAGAQSNGTLVVNLVDANGTALPGACFLVSGEPRTDFVCDGRDDGVADGTVTFSLPPGNYFTTVTSAPDGYISGSRAPTFIVAGQTQEDTIATERGGRYVALTSVNRSGQPIGNSCFDVFRVLDGGQSTVLATTNCDDFAELPGDGNVWLNGMPAGDYFAVQTRTPSGYLTPDPVDFSVPAGGSGSVYVTVTHDSASVVEQLIAVLIAILQQILGS